ncbi:protein phtf [Athalia rosae]|uniref:protein phtf n=1 Tax=Athalia rosae TaxID=37344 RepID=UPI0020334C1F|nr:protein phtf [Athalia rosae]
MGLNDLMYWYQKKIGTYDKQQWEKTLEQRFIDHFIWIPITRANLKTNLIDVDLVRGSSFPKAKPEHGLCTVAYLAVRRLLLLPMHRTWWVQQTSPRIFALFLLLYCLQIFNVVVYCCYSMKNNSEPEIVSAFEVLIPAGMMLVLCMVHSQIVSTSSGRVSGRNREDTTKPRRSKRKRCHVSKKRTHLNPFAHEAQYYQYTASEKGGSVGADMPLSVRFAKNVVIQEPSTIMPIQQSRNTTWKARPENTNEEKNLACNKSFPQTPIVSFNASPVDKKELTTDVVSNNAHIQNETEAVGHQEYIHQEDDGFESLNGNVSSEIGEVVTEQLAVRFKSDEKKETEVEAPSFPGKCRNWYQGMINDRRQLGDVSHQCRSSVHLARTKKEHYLDNEREHGKNPASEVSGTFVVREQQCESEEEGECEDAATNHLTEATTSATEWMGVTTNSDEDCSYSSELQESESDVGVDVNPGESLENPFSWEFEIPKFKRVPSWSAPDSVSCTIWKNGNLGKVELSVLEIASLITYRVEAMRESMDYFYCGLVFSFILSFIPSMWRLSDQITKDQASNITSSLVLGDLSQVILETYPDTLCRIIDIAFGTTLWERTVILISFFERLTLSCLLFFLVAVAERTYKQRLMCAKLFSHLTSSRQARQSELPHFRLNKVRNIKTWLSVRSYLKRRGPQRSVNMIVSAVLLLTLLLLSFISMEYIKDSESLHSQYTVEALCWSCALGIFILRFMMLGTKIDRKYRNVSILLTEQINLYLQIEQKPQNKDELMVANSVLKLAADLLKELESSFKVSGLHANPYMYTITKVVILSALSGVLSELLGFKLKLHKIKIK